MVPADSNGLGSDRVEVSAVRLVALQCHPPQGSAPVHTSKMCIPND